MRQDSADPLFRKLTDRVESAWRDAAEERKRLRERREAVFGDDEHKRGPANLILANLNTLIPFVYAKNPDFSVTPEERADDGGYEARRRLAAFLEVALPKELQAAGLKKKARRCVKSSLVNAVAWLKAGWQGALDAGPVVQSIIPDSQDNLARIEHEADELAEGKADPEDAAELRQLVAGVASGTEIMFAEGLALDIVQPEDIVIDPGVPVADVEEAAWVAQRIWMRRDLAEARYKKRLDKAATWSEPRSDSDGDDKRKEREAASEWVVIWELWDRTMQRVFTWAEGMECWLRAPFSPPAGLRWYPFFPLVLIEDDAGNPVSMVDMLKPLQEAYDKRREAGETHRKKAQPKTVIDGSMLNPGEADKLNAAEGFEAVALDLSGRNPNDIIHTISFPRFDPRMYDTADIRAEMDVISGVQDAMRGAVTKAKTATEASILQQGMSGRVGDMRDQIEDWLGEIARYAASLILQNMSDETARRLAGMEVVLPKMGVADALQLFNIEIKPGTTGKPDEAGERERWMQLMPVMMQMYQMAQQAAASGGDPKPVVEMMKETLRRFDERIDLERFFPETTPEGASDGYGATGDGATAGLAGGVAAAGIPGAAGQLPV